MDLVGPQPSSRGFTYLFTILDRTSHWLEAVPSSISAADCARALISGWISRLGVPVKITSDRRAQFRSSIWEVVCSLLNITRSGTTSFHPVSNTYIVERFHLSLKSSLCARLACRDWCDHLPLVMLGLHSVPPDDSGISTAVALYGDPLCLPGEFLDSDELPPAVFQDRIQSALHGLVLPPPHHQPPPTAKVHKALASETMFWP